MSETNQRDVPTSSLAAVPRGVTVTGLASVHWRTGDGNPLGQIQHAHDDWHANTVRLQVGVPLLRGKTNAAPSWHGGGPVPALTEYLATPGNGMTADSNGCHCNADFLGYLDQAVGLATPARPYRGHLRPARGPGQHGHAGGQRRGVLEDHQ